MIDEKLLDVKYYYDKLPLYLQQSPGFFEHFRYWVELLNGIHEVDVNWDKMLDIFNENYLEINPNCDDFLNKLGLLYGVTRNVKYETEMTLNNKVFLLLIRAQIIKNFFNGTYIMLNEFYNNVAKIPVIYYTVGNLTCNIVLAIDVLAQYDFTTAEKSQIVELFDAGLLTFESLGVIYNREAVDTSTLLIFDVGKWDVNTWGI